MWEFNVYYYYFFWQMTHLIELPYIQLFFVFFFNKIGKKKKNCRIDLPFNYL
jgi:hypothetical protein